MTNTCCSRSESACPTSSQPANATTIATPRDAECRQHLRDRWRIANRGHGDASEHGQHSGCGRAAFAASFGEPGCGRTSMARPMKTPSIAERHHDERIEQQQNRRRQQVESVWTGANPHQQHQRGGGPGHHFSIAATRCSLAARDRDEKRAALRQRRERSHDLCGRWRLLAAGDRDDIALLYARARGARPRLHRQALPLRLLGSPAASIRAMGSSAGSAGGSRRERP